MLGEGWALQTPASLALLVCSCRPGLAAPVAAKGQEPGGKAEMRQSQKKLELPTKSWMFVCCGPGAVLSLRTQSLPSEDSTFH